ncbi:hypothetical protein LNTAR_12166 [Lentisphaera araneosa HTCC2155]|uniref:Uncharacterized protein n=1 Tax=Lentisphaera araneosa HTCC2155 TaxID=313628 RepID=A6DJN4_9BACT|nr:hypothetical protein [Lentisphaera araneosa]EDM28108.1 hypothetical protein LNTAR_12166 [Lentisphaera araneosa HTCC2155]
MSLFNKNIVVLCLAKSGRHLAMKVAKSRSGLELIKSRILDGDHEFSSLQESLDISANDYFVLCDEGSLSVSVNLALPKLAAKELRNAVSFELGNKIPLPVDAVQWGYYRDKDSCQLSVISYEAWDEFILATHEMAFDFFVSSSSLPELSDDLKGLVNKQGENDEALFEQALKVASFCLSNDMNVLKKTMITPPEGRRLKHRFVSKYIMVACMVYVLTSLLMTGLTYYKGKNQYSSQLKSRIAQIQSATPQVDEEAFEYLNELNSEYSSILEKAYSPGAILDELSLRLPAKYLIKSLRTDGLSVNCELTSQDGVLDTKEIYNAFVASDVFTKDIPISQRKGSLQLNLTLNEKGVDHD